MSPHDFRRIALAHDLLARALPDALPRVRPTDQVAPSEDRGPAIRAEADQAG